MKINIIDRVLSILGLARLNRVNNWIDTSLAELENVPDEHFTLDVVKNEFNFCKIYIRNKENDKYWW